MADKTENVRIQLYINADKAQRELKELDKEYRDLIKSQKKFTVDSKEWMAKQGEIDKVTEKQMRLRKSMDLTVLSVGQLKAQASQLKAVLNKMVPGTKEYIELEKHIGKVDARIKQVKGGLGPFAQAWKNLGGEVRGVIVAFAAMAGSQFLSWLKGLVTGAGEVEDQLAELMRTAQATAEEARQIRTELKDIDTRTSTKSLMDMAIVAGQFGVAKEDIAAFVEQMDKAAVVMGSEFGGNAEEVATTLAKLRNVLTDVKSSKIDIDLGKIGNALTVLAQEGVATAPVVSDFANRIGGFGIQAGLTSGQVLGISATLQELAVSTERGGTAVVKIIQKMFSNVEQFAKIAGMSVDDFQVLLNTDLYGAFSLVMKQSKALGGNSVELNKIIQDLEVAGAGASEVFAKLGANTELLDDKVITAGQALTNTSAITEQFSIKNATLGATLDKLGKDFRSLFTSEGVLNGLKYLVFGFVRLIAVLKEIPNFIRDNKTALWLLVTAIAAFNGQLIASRAAALADIAMKKLQEIWILRAEYAQAALNRTMNANPILRITGLILGAVAAYKIFTNDAAAASAAQEKLNEKIKEGTDLLANTGKIEDRFKVINALSKESLNVLKNDIQQEIDAYRAKEAEMMTSLKEGRLRQLEAELDETKDEGKRAFLKGLINEEQKVADATIEIEFGITRTTVQENIKRLNSYQETIDKRIVALSDATKAVKELSEEEKKAADEATNKLEELRAKIAEIGHQQTLDRMSENDREIQVIRDKYASLLSEAKKGSIEEIRLRDLMTEEIIAKMREQQAKEEKLQEKANQDKLKLAEEIRYALLNEQDKEVQDAYNKWQKLIVEARKYGMDATALEEAMWVEIAAIREKHGQEERKKFLDNNNENLDDWQEGLQEIMGIVNNFYNQVSSIMGNLAQISANENEQELNSYTAMMDKKRESLQNQLNSGLISQAEYNVKMNALDKEQKKKEGALKKEAFIKEKKAAKTEAEISMFLAIANALATKPFYVGLIMAALAAAQGATQIAEIESRPVPEFKAGKNAGHIVQGASHDNGGIGLIDSVTGQKVGEMEGDEAIIPKDTTLANQDIIYQLLAAKGKRIQPRLNFDFAPSLERMNAFKNGTPGAASNTRGVPEKESYKSDKDKNTDKLLTTLISEVVDMKNVLKEKEMGISLVGNRGLVKKEQELENIKNIVNI